MKTRQTCAYSLPIKLAAKVKKAAKRLKIPASQFVALALDQAVKGT